MKQDIKAKYFEAITSCLQFYPNELKAFIDMWNEEDYRQVYLFVLKLKQGQFIKLPTSFSEIEEEFYWDHVW